MQAVKIRGYRNHCCSVMDMTKMLKLRASDAVPIPRLHYRDIFKFHDLDWDHEISALPCSWYYYVTCSYEEL